MGALRPALDLSRPLQALTEAGAAFIPHTLSEPFRGHLQHEIQARPFQRLPDQIGPVRQEATILAIDHPQAEAPTVGRAAAMARTTPPPPLDITAAFPELGLLGRRAVRLHPRAGTPGSSDSSLGGPLLWPAEEPWPVCDGWLVTERCEPIAPEDLQRLRRVHDTTHDGWQRVGEETMEEDDERIRIAAGGTIDLVAGDRAAGQPASPPLRRDVPRPRTAGLRAVAVRAAPRADRRVSTL